MARRKSKKAKKPRRIRKVRKVSKKGKPRTVPRRTRPFNAIPPGFRTVTPYLTITGGGQAIEFYKKAFNAREEARQATPDGKIIHARLRIGDSIVMLSDEFPGSSTKSPISAGTTTGTLHIYTADVDGLWQRAVTAGARVVMPLDNQYWGERYGQLADPFGHHWSVSKRVKMSREEMEAKQKAAMAMLSQGEHSETLSQ